jgi:hypothetical protein
MHTSILKLVYIHSDLLYVSPNHMAIFREVKYKGYIKEYKMKFQKYRNQSTDISQISVDWFSYFCNFFFTL